MDCIYCGNSTNVTNSRHQRQRNSVWRRRTCHACGAVFTSIEQTDYETSLAFAASTSQLVPFSRDTLFLSIYDACKHREHATADASALTNTIISKLLAGAVQNGSVTRDAVIQAALQTLQPFDNAAAIHYGAYHK